MLAESPLLPGPFDRPVYLYESAMAPLVMDQNNDCPYGLLAADRGYFLCFDFSLAPRGKERIELNEFSYAAVTFDGKSYEVWAFGKALAGSAKEE